MLADAWATILTVLGPAGLPLAAEHGIAARIVTDEEYVTPVLAAMLEG
jgi:thiamine biosynthesis lipoprotein